MHQIICNIICNIKGNFLFAFLFVVCTLTSIRAQYIGRWVDSIGNIDAVKLKTYLSSPELIVDASIGRNTVVVEDTISQHMIIIVSGMFPFSNMSNQRIKELIDYILPMKSQ